MIASLPVCLPNASKSLQLPKGHVSKALLDWTGDACDDCKGQPVYLGVLSAQNERIPDGGSRDGAGAGGIAIGVFVATCQTVSANKQALSKWVELMESVYPHGRHLHLDNRKLDMLASWAPLETCTLTMQLDVQTSMPASCAHHKRLQHAKLNTQGVPKGSFASSLSYQRMQHFTTHRPEEVPKARCVMFMCTSCSC